MDENKKKLFKEIESKTKCSNDKLNSSKTTEITGKLRNKKYSRKQLIENVKSTVQRFVVFLTKHFDYFL